MGDYLILNGGIIPAYAGSTSPECLSTFLCRDHPRVCGEHVLMMNPSLFSMGSSPRMRGAQALAVFHDNLAGIIPAYAGSTSEQPPSASPPWDHPRVCGEHSISSRSLLS